MINSGTPLRATLTIALLIVGAIAAGTVRSQDADAPTAMTIAIVVHKDTDVENLSMDQLRNIFLANQQFWDDRTRIILLVRAAKSDERDFVLNKIYEMDEAEFRRYWISKMFRAEVPRGPQIVLSSGMTLDLVVAIPGSISFVKASEATADVRVLRIDGKLPSEEGYPLQ
jgi:ABC-type phosphate transport system substrate-binding protein